MYVYTVTRTICKYMISIGGTQTARSEDASYVWLIPPRQLPAAVLCMLRSLPTLHFLLPRYDLKAARRGIRQCERILSVGNLGREGPELERGESDSTATNEK